MKRTKTQSNSQSSYEEAAPGKVEEMEEFCSFGNDKIIKKLHTVFYHYQSLDIYNNFYLEYCSCTTLLIS